jgi:cytoskeletal protein CcmA (bactofilin family)
MTRARNISKLVSDQVEGNVNIAGILTATTFFGDASGLSGLTAVGVGVTILDNGANRGAAQKIDFGDLLVATQSSGGVSTITVGFNTSDTRTSTLVVSGLSTFAGNVEISANLNVSGVSTISTLSGLNVTGISTLGSLDVGDGSSELTFNDGVGLSLTKNLTVSGLSTFAGITTVTGTTLFSNQLSVSGVSTFAGITTVTGTTLFTKQLNVSGVSTFAGITTVTGTTLFSNQLSVSGIITGNSFRPSSGYYQSANGTNSFYVFDTTGNVAFQGTIGASQINTAAGNKAIAFTASSTPSVILNGLGVSGISTLMSSVGIGTTNPNKTLDVRGDVSVSGIITSQHLNVTGLSTISELNLGSGGAEIAGFTTVSNGGYSTVGVVTAANGFVSAANTSPVQIQLVGNQLIFNVVGIGSTTLTLA